ncbi:putative nuclease HARBI1 isoform X1, partial [Aphis craccivora]
MSNLMERKRKALVIAALVLTVDDEDEQIKKRKWSKQWLLEKRKYSHMNLLHELQSNEPADFKNYLRMENHTFYELLDLVRPFIEKQNTIMRE